MQKHTRWMAVLTLASAAVIAEGRPAPAQTTDAGRVREGRGYVMGGLGVLDLGGLNTTLAASGYPEIKERRVSIGGGGHAIRRNWVLGGEGVALVGRTKDVTIGARSHEVALYSGYGMFDLGYLVLNKNDLHVYPFVGIGGGAINLKITEREFATFADVLADPRRTASIYTGQFVVQTALGIDKLFVLARRTVNGRPTEGGLVLGLRAGYVFAPFQSDWMIEDLRLPGGPDAGISGPYVRLVLGGGGRR